MGITPKPDFAFADYALERWARKSANDLQPLSWPPITVLGRVIEFGISGAAQGGARVMEIDEVFQATDRAVARLRPRERLVVTTHYSGVWKTSKECARKTNMSPETFRLILHYARGKVQAYLEGFVEATFPSKAA